MSAVNRILVLCTGNAARSVMAGSALSVVRPDLHVETAGTLSVDGLPMGWRTRTALGAVGLPVPTHRSRQATSSMLEVADLVIGLAPEHVEWVRRNDPTARDRTATLIHLTDSLPAGSQPLADRVATLALDGHHLLPHEEVVDPGGGDVDAFIAAAREIVALVDRLASRL